MDFRFKIFEVKEGKLEIFPDIRSKKIKALIISSILLLIVASVSDWLRIDEKHLLKIYSSIVDHFNLQYVIPKSHIEKSLDSKIELEVDRAIKNVTPEYDKGIEEDNRQYRPRYIEEEAKPENRTGDAGLLGPPMRICAPWVDDCPKE
jgi:hypothetical protein